MASLLRRVLPFWRMAICEKFILCLTGLASPGQPPVMGLGAAGCSVVTPCWVNCPRAELSLPGLRGSAVPLLGCSARGSISPCTSHLAEAGPWEGEEAFSCGRSTKGWLWERWILAEAVRWSGFSCNCRGDFPVVFRPRLSRSCRRGHRCHRITGTVVAATACPGWADGAFREGQRGPCLRSNVSARRCRAGSSGGYAAGWLLGSWSRCVCVGLPLQVI